MDSPSKKKRRKSIPSATEYVMEQDFLEQIFVST